MAVSRHRGVSVKNTLKLGGPVFDVVVGQEPHQQSYTVHESLICSRSLFFKNAMNGNWKESQDRLVPLPEDDPHVFGIYGHFLYTGEIPCRTAPPPKQPIDSISTRLLAELYVFGEKILDQIFREAVIGVFLSWVKEGFFLPSVAAIKVIYDGTPGPCGMRRLLVDLFCYRASGVCKGKEWDLLPRDFLVDLLEVMSKKRACPDDQILSSELDVYLDKPPEKREGS